MRKFLLLLLVVLPLSVQAFTIPERPNSYVKDYATLMSAEQVQSLEVKLNAFEKNTTNEIAVVTIPTLDGDVIENVAQEIFTKWGIGKKDKNNGVLLLVSLEERKTRIHTGYGVEGDLTDLGTSYIQSEVMTPAFRNGDYYGGINGAVDKMIEALGGNNIVPEDYSTSSGASKIPWEFIFFLVFLIFQILAAALGRSKSWWHGGVLFGVVALAIWHFLIASIFIAIPVIIAFIGFGLFFDYMVSKAHTQKETMGSYPWWFGGGSGGFGGGGFGGFGGGGSGGGGSSGGW
ncbi:MAG: TPM domain-containing protein [Candidatus Pacebacteria bacterium]|nr:TPM domain-containing protein [Candidatus Paceibacterota bacterium]